MLYVVDQNRMRSDELRESVDADPSSRFVIPDASFEEMVKHERWQETMRGSFAILAPVPDRVFISANVGELLRYESREGRPVGLEQILPTDVTEAAREFVKGIVSWPAQSSEARDRIKATRRAIIDERPSGEVTKARMSAAIDRLKSVNGRELMGDIRSGRMSADARLALLKGRTESIVRDVLGIDPPDPDVRWQFLTARLVCAMLWYQEHWLYGGGLDDAKPKMLASDEFDKEYVVIASYFDGLLTNDRRARLCDTDLRVVTDPAADGRLTEALERHAVASGRLPDTSG